MMADKLSKQAALFHPQYLGTNDPNLIWTDTGTATKYDLNSEESWVLLPNGKVLTVDMYLDYEAGVPPLGKPTLFLGSRLVLCKGIAFCKQFLIKWS